MDFGFEEARRGRTLNSDYTFVVSLSFPLVILDLIGDPGSTTM
ncbi:MAG TPA: hypothetical protein VFG50_00490 [Rhodothermales bacterium]|nr:hypothetical protein [Rhodothermales bacterium]